MTNKPDDTNNTGKEGMSRRTFLKNTGLVAGGVVGGSLLGGLLTNRRQENTETQTEQMSGGLQDARMFFSRKEDFDILSAATERIFPEDDLGPGAIALGVPYFIDKQLNGEWGMNAKEYMNGPFYQNEYVQGAQDKERNQDRQGPNVETQQPLPTPRYQTRLRRNEIFLIGLREMDHVAQKEFGARFIELEGPQQDQVLQMFEDGKVDMKGYGSKDFFHLLRQTTVEGAYADPLYGGNKDMMGWKMKEYPGPRASYLPQIEEEEFVVLEQQSLKDYQKNA
ncbi:gluconate 2-dehydrogenase subunit 3 family protein [Sporosarcina sp. 179-K 3D1 HS]|uniref:gluconate 2-dehydrogenase subunit 3 family protein n=1 Tax=Sporosarcina sp. 179-K 3D1 HS TaxID=3232169 RepID=UPI0039A1B7B7